MVRLVPLKALIANKELLRHIEFAAGKCTQPVRADSDFGDFRRYALCADWCCVAFEMTAQHELEWVTLCRRQTGRGQTS